MYASNTFNTHPRSTTQRYYLLGSAAPSLVAHRHNRPDYYHPPPPAPPPPPTAGLQQERPCPCCCCKRSSSAGRCARCGIVVVVELEQEEEGERDDATSRRRRGGSAAGEWERRRGGSRDPARGGGGGLYRDTTPSQESEDDGEDTQPVTLIEVQDLIQRQRPRRQPGCSSPPIPSAVDEIQSSFSSLSLSLSPPASSSEAADPPLLAIIHRSFSSLSTLSRSFLPSPSQQLPHQPDLDSFYNLILDSGPEALDALRNAVEKVLDRPGRVEEKGVGWAVVLLECPIFLARWTPDQAVRQRLLARFFGLLSNLPNALHHQLVTLHLSPSSGYPTSLLLKKVELIISFLSARLSSSTPAGPGGGGYDQDWAVKAAAKVGALLFAANLLRPESSSSSSSEESKERQKRLPLSSFYCTLLDSLGEQKLVEGFERWETRDGSFSLCQYPFLLSLGVKILLMNFEGQRSIRDHQRHATTFDLDGRRRRMEMLEIRVRREFVVRDSLRQIEQHRRRLKKGLRIIFEGEEGIDAGGLRKEWFLLLCRQLFDPQWGMFLPFEPDSPSSNLCYFNPTSQDLEEFYLVGVVVGLACFHAATLDVPLPRAVYKKLLGEQVSLADLAQFRPALARGLQQLLEFEETTTTTLPDQTVEQVFCRTFVGEIEEWGQVREVELVEGGAGRVVTRENREEFVRLYVEFHLTTSIQSQFAAFSAGFHEVVAGNSLSLFKGEELELLVRGSDEQLDVEQLKGVTEYKGWDAQDETVLLFWHVFTSFPPSSQRALLSFITGSDRIPATGSSALTLKLTNLGPDGGRWPTSHTCFNELCLYRYRGWDRMRGMLEGAMRESEGFGLK